jgi:beta-glucanase (GH16 family)
MVIVFILTFLSFKKMDKLFFSLFLFTFLLTSCDNKKIQPNIELPGYKLVFQDEFNKSSLDTTIWGFHNLGKRRSAVNVKEACLINENDALEIRNWTEVNGTDTVHYAGMIETKKNFTFGYYEARIKFEIEQGTWGAFWIMYNNYQKLFTEVDNPKETGVEIDIIEFVPQDNNYGVHNLHWNGYGEFHKTKGSGRLMNGQLEGYHVYSLLWTPEEYIFYIDGKETWKSKDAISHVPEFVILSTEIQDNGWAGNIPTSGYGSFEETKNKMLVDYIRIYQK